MSEGRWKRSKEADRTEKAHTDRQILESINRIKGTKKCFEMTVKETEQRAKGSIDTLAEQVAVISCLTFHLFAKCFFRNGSA